MKKYRIAWFRSLSGLAINISAAWFAAAFIGSTIALPKNPEELIFLTVNIIFGIVFLLLSVWFEKKVS